MILLSLHVVQIKYATTILGYLNITVYLTDMGETVLSVIVLICVNCKKMYFSVFSAQTKRQKTETENLPFRKMHF